MMRSAPPFSAHLAEIPVPAPAPRMGTPAALLACHRFRHADRSIMLCFSLATVDTTLLYDCWMPTQRRSLGWRKPPFLCLEFVSSFVPERAGQPADQTNAEICRASKHAFGRR